MSKRILIADYEERIRRLLRMYLEKEGYFIEEASNGKIALSKAEEKNVDLIILDLVLPELNGFEVCRHLRQQNKNTPVLILTAKSEEVNRIQGFEAGADDYVVKPFSPREVVFRIKAILRRTTSEKWFPQKNNSVSVNHPTCPCLIIESEAHRVRVQGCEVLLSPKEYDLLNYLASAPDKVFSREQLIKNVWNYDFFGDLRTVDTHVKRLREKLNRAYPDAAELIATVWGVGYKFEGAE